MTLFSKNICIDKLDEMQQLNTIIYIIEQIKSNLLM